MKDEREVDVGGKEELLASTEEKRGGDLVELWMFGGEMGGR